MNRPIDNNYISKARYYELKWFCRQYREWEKEKSNLKISPGWNFGENVSDPTGELAVKLAELDSKLEIVDQCLLETAPEIYIWLKACVIDGNGYNSMDVPCCKEYFYTRYKLFFSRLNQCI